MDVISNKKINIDVLPKELECLKDGTLCGFGEEKGLFFCIEKLVNFAKEHGEKVESLRFSNESFKHSSFQEVMDLCPNLTRLKISNVTLYTLYEHHSDLKSVHPEMKLTNLDKIKSLCVSNFHYMATTGFKCKFLDRGLSPLVDFKNVEELDLSGSYNNIPEKNLSNIVSLKNLRKLRITATVQHGEPITDFSHIKYFEHLQELDLSGYNTLKDLSCIKTLEQLVYLNLKGCNNIQSLQPLAKLTNLHTLILHRTLGYQNCKIKSLEPIAKLTNLQHLDLAGFYTIRSLDHLKGLTRLQHLNLGGAFKITCLDPLKNLKDLSEVNLYHCNKITSLAPLFESHSTIKKLSVGNWVMTEEVFKQILQFKNLEQIDLYGCRSINKIERLQSLKSLTELNICYLGVNDPKVFEKFESLKSVTIDRNSGVNVTNWLEKGINVTFN